MSIYPPDEYEPSVVEPVADHPRQKRQFSPGRVAIFGAGIAGLTAAHELAERGFSVIVVEPEAEGEGTSRVGGMARSQARVGEPERFGQGAVMPWTMGQSSKGEYGAKEA